MDHALVLRHLLRMTRFHPRQQRCGRKIITRFEARPDPVHRLSHPIKGRPRSIIGRPNGRLERGPVPGVVGAVAAVLASRIGRRGCLGNGGWIDGPPVVVVVNWESGIQGALFWVGEVRRSFGWCFADGSDRGVYVVQITVIALPDSLTNDIDVTGHEELLECFGGEAGKEAHHHEEERQSPEGKLAVDLRSGLVEFDRGRGTYRVHTGPEPDQEYTDGDQE